MLYTLATVAVWYLLLSFITYVVYAFDKRAAQRQERRVPEKWLHLLAVGGGWPGAFLAQQRIRHKNRKISFQLVFWLTVLLNIALVVWLWMNILPR